MLRRLSIFGLFILLAGLALAQEPLSDHQLNPAERPRSQARRRPDFNPTVPSATPSPIPPPVAPIPAPVFPPASQPGSPSAPQQATQLLPPVGPSTPPVVTYRDGLLTVQALNSTLGSVLTAIRNKTGIEFEG